MATTVEFENDQVRVLRVKHTGREQAAQSSRLDRLIIYLNEGRVRRTENSKQEVVRHKAGDVVWRNRSRHEIENLNDVDHEVVIVEMKRLE
jgi:hypothetical protein